MANLLSANLIRKNITLGIFWFLISLIISVSNDSITKHLSSNLENYQIVFCRFFMSTILLLPFMLGSGLKSFKIIKLSHHLIRGLLTFMAIILWSFSLKLVPLVVATIISFTIPFFVLILAKIFLKEKIGYFMVLVTILGFVGVLITYKSTSYELNIAVAILLVASFLFAAIDVFNKKQIQKENIVTVLFYTSIIRSVISFMLAYKNWQSMSIHEVHFMIWLSAGSNLLLYSILRALKFVDISLLAPFRFIELIIAAIVGYLFFRELPSNDLIIGSIVTFISAGFLGWIEIKMANNSNNNA